MNYNEAINYIETTHRFGRVLGLANIKRLLELLGNPQDDLKFIHVAGTNGKGSTCSYISSILKEAGYKTGLFTSPYLESFTERIRIDGENIDEVELAKITETIKEKIEIMVEEGGNHPTEFEIVTAMAIMHYSNQNVDFVVFEVGLGGRFDATNVIKKPLVSVITPIGLDHTDYLGDSIDKIAYEKAGIIKEGIPLVIYPQHEDARRVIEDVAEKAKAKVIKADVDSIRINSKSLDGQSFDAKVNGQLREGLKISLVGEHQVKNALVALNVIDLIRKGGFEISKEDERRGLESARWPGRVEIFRGNPNVIIDGAHNLDGANSLNDVIDDYLKDEKINLVIGMLRDKDVDGVLRLLLPKVKGVIATRPDSDRSLSVIEMKDRIHSIDPEKKVDCIENIDEAVEAAIRGSKGETVLCAGSLYMVGHVRGIIKNR